VSHVTFRTTIGVIVVVGGLAGLLTLYFVAVPTVNRDAIVLALGVVLGWGSSIVNGEWGSSPEGRRMAEISAAHVTASVGGPAQVEVINKPGDPVPVETSQESDDVRTIP
jgi:hypothetical protein